MSKMKINDVIKPRSHTTFGNLKAPDLFKWLNDKDVHMRTKNGYVNLVTGSMSDVAHLGYHNSVVRIDGELTIWSAE